MRLLINHILVHQTATRTKLVENLSLKSNTIIKLIRCLFSFLLSNEIGNGSFGRVYSGFDNDHGIVMAVKQVPIMNLSST
jgi:hypothetical protein